MSLSVPALVPSRADQQLGVEPLSQPLFSCSLLTAGVWVLFFLQIEDLWQPRVQVCQCHFPHTGLCLLPFLLGRLGFLPHRGLHLVALGSADAEMGIELGPSHAGKHLNSWVMSWGRAPVL